MADVCRRDRGRLPAGARPPRRGRRHPGQQYGESGAVDRYGASFGLPHAYGAHRGYWYRGPPPASATSVLAIGFDQGLLTRCCNDPVLLTRLDNHVGLHNDEQGAPVWPCVTRRAPWQELWPRLRVIG